MEYVFIMLNYINLNIFETKYFIAPKTKKLKIISKGRMKEFKVNEYITLKLEGIKTNIYVKGQLFNQCKFLLLNIPIENSNICNLYIKKKKKYFDNLSF